jgi:hypothetical protein
VAAAVTVVTVEATSERRSVRPPVSFNALVDHLSYANVVATLALFIALGGASYAARSLPQNSVGTSQLKLGAVEPSRLGFPLGVASRVDKSSEDLVQGACNGGPSLPGNAVPPCVPPTRGGPTPGREVQLHLRYPSRLVISSVAALAKQGQRETRARVRATLVLDDRAIATSPFSLDGGESTEAVSEDAISVPAGAHTVGASYDGEYFGSGPGDVIVGPVTVIVTTLPDA